MSEQFTKGPWLWGGASVVLESEGTPLCCLVNSAVNTGDNTEDYANAALIACAPEMYEMLKCIRDHVQIPQSYENRVDAVLAKARGESSQSEAATKLQLRSFRQTTSCRWRLSIRLDCSLRATNGRHLLQQLIFMMM